MQPNMLDGVRVVDFTQFVAGPSCTRLMAEMGADVIKIEMAPNGDLCRIIPTIVDGRSAYFSQHNLGKKSICLDLRNPEALAVAKDLIKTADLVMESFSPGVFARLGLGWDVVHELNPKAIMCSISAFGQAGPRANMPGFDYIAQAVAGVTHMIGEEDRAPSLPGVAVGDIGTGITALAAVMTALFHRERTGGEGQYLDISLLDFYFYCHEINVQISSTTNGQVKPMRSGSQHPIVAPIGVYKGPEGYIVILVLGDQWGRMCRAIGKEEWIDDPRFATTESRFENKDITNEAIEGWLAQFETDADAIAALEKARVPVAPIYTVHQAMQDPHLLQRKTVATVNDPVVGAYSVPANPLRFSDFPPADPPRAPFLGEHNASVLADVLGYAPDQVDSLLETGGFHAENR